MNALIGWICPFMLLVGYALVALAAAAGKKTNHGWETSDD